MKQNNNKLTEYADGFPRGFFFIVKEKRKEKHEQNCYLWKTNKFYSHSGNELLKK